MTEERLNSVGGMLSCDGLLAWLWYGAGLQQHFEHGEYREQ